MSGAAVGRSTAVADPARLARQQRRPATSAKVVVTGPFAAGKTTLIKTISEITVLSTERKVSDHTAAQKQLTTVAMDFGRLTIDDEIVLHLFGTPGQERFDFMWQILAKGMLGFVVLVDDSRVETYDDVAVILNFFRSAASVPYVVGVNRYTGDGERAVERARHLLRLEPSTRVVACDVLDKESVKSVLLELLYAVVDDIDARAEAGDGDRDEPR